MLIPLPELVSAARQGLRCLDAATALAEVRGNGGSVIDVREPAEMANNPAPTSIGIPRGVLEMKICEVSTNPDHPIYLHCATGGRATFAAEQLRRVGYQNITVITCTIETVRDEQEK